MHQLFQKYQEEVMGTALDNVTNVCLQSTEGRNNTCDTIQFDGIEITKPGKVSKICEFQWSSVNFR
jgi:hypothetical protein